MKQVIETGGAAGRRGGARRDRRRRRPLSRLRCAPHDKITIEVLFADAYHVRLTDNDDEIIGRTLAPQPYTRTLPVRLLTMDTSVALRARMLDVRVLKPTRDIGDKPVKSDSTLTVKTKALPER